jgi:hypothetical protein
MRVKKMNNDKDVVLVVVTTENGPAEMKFTQYRDQQGFFANEYEGGDEPVSLTQAASNLKNSMEDIRRMIRGEKTVITAHTVVEIHSTTTITAAAVKKATKNVPMSSFGYSTPGYPKAKAAATPARTQLGKLKHK